MLSFIKLDEETFNQFKRIRKEPNNAEEILGKEKLEYVIKNKILVNDYDDEEYINTLKYKKRLESFSTKVLSLVIAPTLGCNFACPYCYEKSLPLELMGDDIQDKIISFANDYSDYCKGISLCWHGGEPLIAFNQIKQLYSKFENNCKLPILNNSIVTNGYLLTEEICRFFDKVGLEYMQITLDGNREIHDKTRVLKNGKSSFDKIIQNIDMAIKLMPHTTIGVRTNIGRSNYQCYEELFAEYSERWKGTNAYLYDTFVSDSSRSCLCSECSFELTTRQKNNFKLNLAKKGIISSKSLYSQLDNEFYTCGDENAFVIDPRGNLFKCWADIGILEKAIGTIDEGITRFDIVSQYIVGSDKFSDTKCMKCKFLPICDGGCNLVRINAKNNNVPVNACPIDSEGIKKYLSLIYEDIKRNKEQV